MFTWNARDQVASLNSATLQYDAFGRRIRNATGKSFLYDGSNAGQELTGTTPTANVLTGGIDELFQRTDGNGTVVPLTDVLGGTIALVDSGGNIATTYSYDPFGNTTASGAASGNPSRYIGRENEGNQLYYLRARYFNPIIGRFVSEDPIGFAGGINQYAYANDSPTNLVDPYGLESGNLNTLVPGPNGETSGKAPDLAGRKDDAKWWSDFWHEMFYGDPLRGPNGKPLCIAVYADSIREEFNPMGTQPDDIAEAESEGALEGLKYAFTAAAVNHALARGLPYALRSTIVQGWLEKAALADEAIPHVALLFADYKLTKALFQNIDARRSGECYASFLPPSAQ